MSKQEYQVKARINQDIEDSILRVQEEMGGVDRSEAIRELLRRGAGVAASVVIRPNWADKDLVAITHVREAAYQLHTDVKELRPLVIDEIGDDIDRRRRVAEVVDNVYGEYIKIRGIFSALSTVDPGDVDLLRQCKLRLLSQEFKDDYTAQMLARLLDKLGF